MVDDSHNFSSCFQPGLFGGLLNALHVDDDAAVALAAEVLCKLLGEKCTFFSTCTRYFLHVTAGCGHEARQLNSFAGHQCEADDPAANKRAIQETIRSIVSLASRPMATADGHLEATAAAAVGIACAIAGRMPEFAVGDGEEVRQIRGGIC